MLAGVIATGLWDSNCPDIENLYSFSDPSDSKLVTLRFIRNHLFLSIFLDLRYVIYCLTRFSCENLVAGGLAREGAQASFSSVAKFYTLQMSAASLTLPTEWGRGPRTASLKKEHGVNGVRMWHRSGGKNTLFTRSDEVERD